MKQIRFDSTVDDVETACVSKTSTTVEGFVYSMQEVPSLFLRDLRGQIMNHRFIEMPPHLKSAVESEIKMLLHAERDCMRNQGKDATKISYFSPMKDSYYCEAFGMLRTLQIMGFGEYGANNARPAEPPNLKAWFDKLQEEVMEEEGFHTDNRCEWCLERYGKDDKSEREKREAERGQIHAQVCNSV